MRCTVEGPTDLDSLIDFQVHQEIIKNQYHFSHLKRRLTLKFLFLKNLSFFLLFFFFFGFHKLHTRSMNLKILLWFMTLSSLINLISSEIDEVDRLSQLGLQNLINYTQSQDLEIEMRCLIEKKMRCDRDPNHDLLGIRMEW